MEKKTFIVKIETNGTDAEHLEYFESLIAKAVYDACQKSNDDMEKEPAHLVSVALWD